MQQLSHTVTLIRTSASSARLHSPLLCAYLRTPLLSTVSLTTCAGLALGHSTVTGEPLSEVSQVHQAALHGCTPLELHTCRAWLQHSRLHDHTHVVTRKRTRNAMADDACSGDCDEPVSTLKARLYDLKWHVPRFVKHVTTCCEFHTLLSSVLSACTAMHCDQDSDCHAGQVFSPIQTSSCVLIASPGSFFMHAC